MFNKFKVGVVVFIISLFIIGCMSLKTHVSNIEIKKYTNEYSIGSENFVYLIKQLTPMISCVEPEACPPVIGSTASGFVLSYDKSSIFVMTAAHFCIPEEDAMFFEEDILGYANDTPRYLHLLYLDEKTDICLLFGIKEKGDKFNNLKLAKKNTIGEQLYTVAAPVGIGGPGKRLIFTGIMGGCDNEVCMSTIPATFGSSGGAIYNSKSELVSIVMAVPKDFDHIILSPSNKDIIKFIEDIDSIVDIYPYN